MSYQHNLNNWRLLADRFIWYDSNALQGIPEEVTDKEIQDYLFTYHGDDISLEEIRQWREGKQVAIDD
ncbi:MAG TPA: hypothetical protein VFQ30_12855 [Ktedonobacteraceae bacterium]|nr:hypothetical protein [Ktedonobacteraceae bacterium]